jgi:hypothetical protein
MTTTYTASHNDKIIGVRKTRDRSYSHAVIVQRNLEDARAKAANWKPGRHDREQFEHYQAIANGGYAYLTQRYPHSYGGKYGPELAVKHIDDAKAFVAGGYDAAMARQRQKRIDDVEYALAQGGFEPKVATWCGRLDLAHKAAPRFTGDYYTGRVDLVAIVPAIAVS